MAVLDPAAPSGLLSFRPTGMIASLTLSWIAGSLKTCTSDRTRSSGKSRSAEWPPFSFNSVDRFEPRLKKTSHCGANLRGVDFSEANHPRIDLRNACLKHVDLSRAVIENAGMRDAVLAGSDLRSSGLEGVDLYKSNLRSA